MAGKKQTAAKKHKKQRDNAELSRDGLNAKQRRFVVEYIKNPRNQADAAIAAGYSAKSAYSQASRLLKNAKIKAVLDQIYADQILSANEVLMRLSQHADASLRPFYDIEAGEFDFDTEDAKAQFHLIKKLKQTTRTSKDGDSYTTVEVEVHDPQSALRDLGRYHKLFTDKIETKQEDDQFDLQQELRKQLIERIDRLAHISNDDPEQSAE